MDWLKRLSTGCQITVSEFSEIFIIAIEPQTFQQARCRDPFPNALCDKLDFWMRFVSVKLHTNFFSIEFNVNLIDK